MWWENKGKARVIGKKLRTNQRRLNRSSALIPILLSCIAIAALILILHAANATTSSAHSPSSPLLHPCTLSSPVPGALSHPLPNHARFASLHHAQAACANDPACLAIAHLPWQTASQRYELHGSRKRVGSLDGQVAYILENCARVPRGGAGFGRIRAAPVVVSEDLQSGDRREGGAGLGFQRSGSFSENARATIFVGIASYRDDMCSGTVVRALQQAKYPERLFFGVVDQSVEGDSACVPTKRACKEEPGNVLCRHLRQIRVSRVDAREAKGPTWGRHRADAMYAGEYFAMQIDAHMFFVKDWDEDVVQQWLRTGNEMAVLSTYPSIAKDSIDANGRSTVDTTPVMCRTKFVGDQQMLKHDQAVEIEPRDDNMPILHVWWAAGISFSRGHRIARVPYDCCLPMLFDGEEASMAARMWTSGYDFYTFHHSAVFHTYFRKKRPPMFWENDNRFPYAEEQAEQRIRHLFKLSTVYEFDKTSLEKYGLGKERPLEQFLHITGVDFVTGKLRDNCHAVENYHFHDALTPFCCDGLNGIDYKRVPSDVVRNRFETAAEQARQGQGPYRGLS